MKYRGKAAALLIAGAIATQAWAQATSDFDSLSGSSKNSPGLDQKPGGGPNAAPKTVSGEQVYRQICQACHMADARGGSGAGTIPALAANPRLSGAAYPITVVVRGKGAMPPMTTLLNQAQVAAVVGYVRTHFGNNYAAPVTEADVRKLWVAPSANDH
jgi:mono/diheme cytochrome c family protein